MRMVYALFAYGTGDGMEPQVCVRQTLDEARLSALDMLDYGLDDEVEADGDEDSVDSLLSSSRDEVLRWSGEDSLEVDYFDGNMGRLFLCRVPLP